MAAVITQSCPKCGASTSVYNAEGVYTINGIYSYSCPSCGSTNRFKGNFTVNVDRVPRGATLAKMERLV